jgi:hypothetical protein
VIGLPATACHVDARVGPSVCGFIANSLAYRSFGSNRLQPAFVQHDFGFNNGHEESAILQGWENSGLTPANPNLRTHRRGHFLHGRSQVEGSDNTQLNYQ